MTREVLKTKSKAEVMDFIRERLAFEPVEQHLRFIDQNQFKKEHKRFNMTGYEGQPGACTLSNLAIINAFADLGIYDYTNYLFLDFHNGMGTLYYQYFGEMENRELELGGYGTSEIIYMIFERTIFSGRNSRRRMLEAV